MTKEEMTDVKPVEKVIAEHPFLKGLKPAHLAVLNQNAMRVYYKAGEHVFHEGEPANRFYLIEEGKVSLESRQAEAPPRQVEIIGAGDVLGWSWLFPPYYWHFDARVIEPMTAIFFYGTRLRQECDQNFELGYELMKRVAGVAIQRLQSTRRQMLAQG